MTGQAGKGGNMEGMETKTVKAMIEWMAENGHTKAEILDCICKMVGANPVFKEKEEKAD